MRDRQAALEAKRQALLEAVVDMMDPSSVYVEDSVQVGEGTQLLPGTILRGDTVVGRNCQIGPNVMLTSCTVEDECAINASQCEESVIRKGCQIGPYTHIRPHCVVGEGSKIGAFVQLKNCNLGKGTKMAHLTYVGDKMCIRDSRDSSPQEPSSSPRSSRDFTSSSSCHCQVLARSATRAHSENTTQTSPGR